MINIILSSHISRAIVLLFLSYLQFLLKTFTVRLSLYVHPPEIEPAITK